MSEYLASCKPATNGAVVYRAGDQWSESIDNATVYPTIEQAQQVLADLPDDIETQAIPYEPPSTEPPSTDQAT